MSQSNCGGVPPMTRLLTAICFFEWRRFSIVAVKTATTSIFLLLGLLFDDLVNHKPLSVHQQASFLIVYVFVDLVLFNSIKERECVIKALFFRD